MIYNFSTSIERIQHSLSAKSLPIPVNIALELIAERPDRRVICTIGEIQPFHCALLPDGNGGYHIMLNKKRLQQISQSKQIEVSLKVDHSKFGMPLPEAFEAVLESDPQGRKHFMNLSPGKQRSLIHLVGKVKSENLRIEKSLIITTHLKRLKGDLDYKLLNQDFRKGYQEDI